MKITSVIKSTEDVIKVPRYKKLSLNLTLEFDEAVTEEEAYLIAIQRLTREDSAEAPKTPKKAKKEEVHTEEKKDEREANVEASEPKKKKSTDIDEDFLKLLKSKGYTITQMANELGTSKSTVYRKCIELGINTSKVSPR